MLRYLCIREPRSAPLLFPKRPAQAQIRSGARPATHTQRSCVCMIRAAEECSQSRRTEGPPVAPCHGHDADVCAVGRGATLRKAPDQSAGALLNSGYIMNGNRVLSWPILLLRALPTGCGTAGKGQRGPRARYVARRVLQCMQPGAGGGPNSSRCEDGGCSDPKVATGFQG